MMAAATAAPIQAVMLLTLITSVLMVRTRPSTLYGPMEGSKGHQKHPANHPSRQETHPLEQSAHGENRMNNDTDGGDIFTSVAKSTNNYPPSPTNRTEQTHQTVYAFTADLASTTEVDDGSTIRFDEVRVNEGGRYFGFSGQFVCPDDGVYVFIWSVMMDFASNSRCLASLSLGGAEIKRGPKTSFFTYNHFSGSSQMLAVVQCTPLAAVTVTSRVHPPPLYHRDFPTFSGFLLSPIGSAVAFTAELSDELNSRPGTRIVFDSVISNFGGHYDSLQGSFLCPDDGVYSFTVSAHFPEYDNRWSVSNLMYDGSVYLQGPITYRATPAADHDSGSSSVSVLLQCEQGKEVYVEARETFTFPYSVYGPRLTSFAGFTLCSDDCNDLVAFSAVLSYNVSGSRADVVFDDVLLNQGNRYNPSYGTFTCPDHKLYMFTWSATSITGWYGLHLYVDHDLVKFHHMTYQPSDDQYGTSGTSSTSTIISCSTGSTVSLRPSLSDPSYILLAEYTVFSGYQIPGQ